ncbi:MULTISPECIES: helix-turn-helix domain-containing protein [unclassified Providencia]|uniref:helix-turn-helix domain-containing protein n=1 Tax=unclassified Providencia TaxID=2633465 RepID=UPI003C2B3B3D
MSIDYSKKLLCIRKAEGFTQQQFADLVNISLSTVKNYETGQQPARAAIMESVIQVERFEKYALWLTIGKTNEALGQISPTLSPDGQERAALPHSEQKIG